MVGENTEKENGQRPIIPTRSIHYLQSECFKFLGEKNYAGEMEVVEAITTENSTTEVLSNQSKTT